MYSFTCVELRTTASVRSTIAFAALRPLSQVRRLRAPGSTVLRYASDAAQSSQDPPLSANLERYSLPQGLLFGQDVTAYSRFEMQKEAFPPVIQQARNNMFKYKDCVVITRVGNFYELYFEQAEEYGHILNLKVASKKTSAGPVPMAGFPFFQLDRYLKILVQDYAKHVAISEEIPLDTSRRVKLGGTLFNREVKRIITPGTLIDEQFLDPRKNNYLLTVSVESDYESAQPTGEFERKQHEETGRSLAGLAWLDLSSGDFFTQRTTVDVLPSTIARISPNEVVLRSTQRSKLDKNMFAATEGLLAISSHDPEILEDEDSMNSMDDMSWDFSSVEVNAIRLLKDYVRQQLPGLTFKYQKPIRQDPRDFMGIDKNSLRGLELTNTLRDGHYKGSLLHAIRRTSTESGTRLLTQRLCCPSTSLRVINERLDIVEAFTKYPQMIKDISSLLLRTADSLRLIQKFSFARGDAHDLLALARTIDVTEAISSSIQKGTHENYQCLTQLIEKFSFMGPRQLADNINSAIDEEGLMERRRTNDTEEAEAAAQAQVAIGTESNSEDMTDLVKKLAVKTSKHNGVIEDEKSRLSDGWIMRRNASHALERLHDDLKHLRADRDDLETTLRTESSLSSLTLKFAPGIGYFVHLKGKDIGADLSVLGKTRTVGASKSTRSFYLPQWTDMGARLDDAVNRIRVEETMIFSGLQEQVLQNLVALRRNAHVLDELDVGCSFAKLAIEYQLTRPHISSNLKHDVIKGRHMTVEQGLEASGRTFTPNDCNLDATPDLPSDRRSARIWLITGPNMAGKSTFLRQTAILSILAQTGSFVPALHAELGLVDQVFSRVGSADNLAADQSTFMVEMLETAYILKHATSRSFVIMDEVGRGTAPEDGIAIGYAVLEHLLETNRCRGLFATHFHKLANLFEGRPGLAPYCTRIIEESADAFRFDHRLRPGINRSSHALNVAKLAGVPDSVIATAQKVLMSESMRLAENTPEVIVY